MHATLTTELFWLTMTVLMTSMFWIPYIANRMRAQGIGTAVWDPHGRTDTASDWARRMKQAHENAVENLVIFAPLVFLIQWTQTHSTVTATACMIYFFARLTH